MIYLVFSTGNRLEVVGPFKNPAERQSFKDSLREKHRWTATGYPGAISLGDMLLREAPTLTPEEFLDSWRGDPQRGLRP